ncbi:Organic hydroperoxide resistance transcriptional regulator (plasmid) [Roseovarius sp. THAF9]|nr:Organic hydroperoxide resistance transcriptional regulator [Roseovarius sp. THAF9]
MMHSRQLRLDDQLCFALYAATNAVTRAYRPFLNNLNLTYPQYLVMLVLWQDGPSSHGQIANRLKLSQNAITPLVDRLVAQGFAERTRKESDRRVVTVQATQEGLDLEGSVSLAQQSVECQTGFHPDALAQIRDELIALADRMEQENAKT